MRSSSLPTSSVAIAAALVAVVAAGCSGARARDVSGDRRPRRDAPEAAPDGGAGLGVPEPPREAAQPVAVGKHPRLFVRASARALAVDATSVYYGDSEDDGVFAMPKTGGTTVKLARHAPVAGAIALDGDSIVWIASPGDAVLKLSVHGGQPTTLRDRGIFSDVATGAGDVFIAEAIGAGGTLLRGATAARVASFDGAPRAVMADATHTYVVTPAKIFRTPHVKGELETIATGTAFGSAEIDDTSVYVVAEVDKARVVVRFPKAGGPMTTVARDLRDGPIEVIGNDLIYFDANRPQLRAVSTAGGEPRVLSEDEALASPTAIEADATTVYVATGSRESGAILAVDRR